MRLLARAFTFLVALATAPVRSVVRRRAVPKGSMVHVKLQGKVVDIDGPLPFFARFAGAAPRTSLHALTRIGKAIANDDRVRGLLITFQDPSFGMAQAEGVREVLEMLRKAGKEVVIHLPEGTGTAGYFVASAASKIFLGPMASLALVGFAARPLYLKGLLDRAGVEADVYAKGRFKSMGELFVRDSMSDAQHEQMDALLDGFYSSLVDGIAAGRNLEKEAARTLVDEGPYFGARAKSAGLVDDLCHEDEIAERLGLFDPKRVSADKAALKAGEKGLLIDGHLYDAITLAAELPAVLTKKKIVVLPARGSIVGGQRQQEGVVADRPFIATVQALAKDPNVAGVVLLVDSGGGSALASDRMHHALVALGNEKPLVAYFSNVAASGGYYLGAAAKKIVARPRTITGSIGVVAVRPVVDGVLGKLGVVRDGVVRGKNAGLLEAGRRLDEEERSAVMRELDGCYEGFLSVVGAGRGLTREEVLHVAEGRVWTGEAAASNGLVDRLGGLETAIEEVRALGGEAAKQADIALVSPPKPTLANLLRANLGAQVAALGWAERALTTLGIDGETLALAAETGPLFVSPIRIE